MFPILVAGFLAALGRRAPRAIAFSTSILTALLVAATALSMVVETRYDPYVFSLGGDPSTHGFSLSLLLVIDNTGGMLTLIAAVLTLAVLIFSSCYLPATENGFNAAALLFLAGASGVSLTGDLLNLVVFFELLGLSAAVLSRSCAEEPGPPQAARNLFIIHGVAAALLLAGTALLFAQTGTTNMAQAGRLLAQAPGPIVWISFALIAAALFVQAAIAPFHLWFPEAVALAPAPVSGLLAGVLVETGLYAATRIYWAVYSGALAPEQNHLRNVLACFGAVTALLGALMCYSERHLKRILAFATVAQMGILLMGIGLFTPAGLAGSSIAVMGFSTLVGGLFLASGILLYRTATYDEIELTGRPRHLRWTGAIFFLGAAGLAGLPPFGIFWGQIMLDGSANQLGYPWIPAVAFASAVLSAGALFRFAGRAFFRWGPPVEEFAESSRPAERIDVKVHHHTPAAMYAPAAALLILGAIAGLAPRLTGAAAAAAIHVQDRAAYAERILDLQAPYPPTVRDQPATGADVARGFGAVLAAALLAALTLGSAGARQAVGESPVAQAVVGGMRALHCLPLAGQIALVAGGAVLLLAAFLL